MADATKLAEALREAVFRESEQAGAEVCVGIVRRETREGQPEVRWGVLVRLARP